MNKTTKFFIVVIVLVFVSGLINAQPFMGEEKGHKMMKPGPEHIFMLLKMKQKDLKISDKQMEQIQSKEFALEETVIKLKNQESLQRLEMKKLMMNEKNKNYDKIKTVMNRMSDIRHSIFIENLKTMDAIMSILTPQQHEALEKERPKRFGHKMPPPPEMENNMRGMEREMRDIDRREPGPQMGKGMDDTDEEPGFDYFEEQ